MTTENKTFETPLDAAFSTATHIEVNGSPARYVYDEKQPWDKRSQLHVEGQSEPHYVDGTFTAKFTTEGLTNVLDLAEQALDIRCEVCQPLSAQLINDAGGHASE